MGGHFFMSPDTEICRYGLHSAPRTRSDAACIEESSRKRTAVGPEAGLHNQPLAEKCTSPVRTALC